jgi:NAD(P)H-flavin reductase
MRISKGRVAEVQLRSGEARLLIACPDKLVPAAGQYLLAAENEAIQATPLFPAGDWSKGFQAASPYPESWRPGSELNLYGPLGKGFHLPADTRRLALIATGESNARLMPLASASESDRYNVTLFSDAPLGELPPDLEAYPLKDANESLNWADFFALDVPLERLEALSDVFGDNSQDLADRRGQVLVHASMPCGGMGDCGVCAVKVRRSWKLACRDGPVFDLQAVLKGVSW